MKASHPIYKTENEAMTERDRQKRLNRTVSMPWQDDRSYWRLTILHTDSVDSLEMLIQKALDNHIVDLFEDLPYVKQTDHTIYDRDSLRIWLLKALTQDEVQIESQKVWYQKLDDDEHDQEIIDNSE